MSASAPSSSRVSTRPWQNPAFVHGLRDQGSVALGIAAWGLVTGVAMVKSGLSVPMALVMTLLVYAGSSQLAVLPLLAAGSPLWVIWLTAICVNLRFVIFSSIWRQYFGHLPRARRLWMGYLSTDMLFVLFTKRYASQPPSKEQESYYWASAMVTWLTWQAASIAGIFLAQVVPLSWGLGFAGILALVGVTLSLLVDKTTWLATIVAGSAAIAAYALPMKLNILVAIAAAVAVGLLYEASENALETMRKRPGPNATTHAADINREPGENHDTP